EGARAIPVEDASVEPVRLGEEILQHEVPEHRRRDHEDEVTADRVGLSGSPDAQPGGGAGATRIDELAHSFVDFEPDGDESVDGLLYLVRVVDDVERGVLGVAQRGNRVQPAVEVGQADEEAARRKLHRRPRRLQRELPPLILGVEVRAGGLDPALDEGYGPARGLPELDGAAEMAREDVRAEV